MSANEINYYIDDAKFELNILSDIISDIIDESSKEPIKIELQTTKKSYDCISVFESIEINSYLTNRLNRTVIFKRVVKPDMLTYLVTLY